MKKLHECFMRMNHPHTLQSYDLKKEGVLDFDKVSKNELLLKAFENPYEELSYHELDPNHKDTLRNIKNWLRYRICMGLKLYTDPDFECDTTDLVKDWFQEILLLNGYKVDKIEGRVFYLSNGILLETDTMTSYATPFNKFLRHCLIDLNLDPNYGQNYKKLFEITSDSTIHRDIYFLMHIDEWYESLSTDENIAKAFDILNYFAYSTTTIGNMTLVPFHFNYHGYDTGRQSELWDEALRDLKTRPVNSLDANFAWYLENYHIFAYDEFFTNHCTKDNFKINEVKDDCLAREAFINSKNNDILDLINKYFVIIITKIDIRGYILYDTLYSKFIFDQRNLGIIVEDGSSLKKFNALLGTNIPTKEPRNLTYSKDEKIAFFIRRYAKYFISYKSEVLSYFEQETGLTICHMIADNTNKIRITSDKIYPKEPRDLKEKKYDINIIEYCDSLEAADQSIKITNIIHKEN